jgi:hypothetical protein
MNRKRFNVAINVDGNYDWHNLIRKFQIVSRVNNSTISDMVIKFIENEVAKNSYIWKGGDNAMQ